ncbi:MAG: glycosyltransferase family 4 protein [Mucilaginibacter sp.]|uniref:glycosyltransferase family 4 protein n=1 Tax=Mucilaginibacter sp. TaxID=1882438 RepID=UPI0034E40A5C
MRKKPVVLVYRKAFPHVFSIEFIFDQLKTSLQTSRSIDKYILPKFSNSILNRVFNIFSLLSFQNKIVHITGDVHYAILGAWFSRRVLTIHDLAFLHQNKGIKRSILKWFWIILPVKFAHRVTVISEATKADVLKQVKVNPQKIRVIPDFISDRFQPIPARTFNWEKPNLLQIGTAFNKNINRLATAISEIPCTLTIVAELDQKTKQTLNQFNIQYINKIDLTEDELYHEYANADLLTFVSTIEGFGMPIVEANACGLPVITANCSSMPEVAGNAALLVDPFDIQSIKNGIVKLIEDENLRNSLVKKGFENAKRFSKAKVVAQYELLYQELENENLTNQRK